MNIRPLFDRVVLKSEPEKVSDAGIYIPRESNERSKMMTVVAVGEECTSVAVGDKVLINKYAGSEMAGFWVVKQCDILGVICEK